MIVESNLLIPVLDHRLLLTLWRSWHGWVWIEVSCSFVLLTLWTFCLMFQFNFRVQFFTLKEFLRLRLLWGWFTTDLVSFLLLVLSVTHVSDGVALIRGCSSSHWCVLFDQSFWWRDHLLESLISKVRLILLSSILESKLLLGLRHFARLIWQLRFRRNFTGLCGRLCSCIKRRNCLFTCLFLHELLEKLAILELCYIAYLLRFLVLLISLCSLLIVNVARRLNRLKLNLWLQLLCCLPA